MKKLIALIFIFFFIISEAKTFKPLRDSIQKTKKIQLNGFYLNAGLFISPSVRMGRTQLKKAWPAFQGKPYADYMESGYSGSGYTGNSCYEIGASFYTNFCKKDSLHNRWQMQIGIIYLSQQSAISSFENYTAIRLDTLNSTSGGPDYYKDQVHYNTVYVTHSSDLAGLNICQTFTGDFKNFFSLAGGVGLNVLASLNARIHENSGVWSGTFVTQDSLYDYNSKKPGLQDFTFTFNENSYASPSVFSLFTLYLTGGCNFRWLNSKNGLCLILNPMVRAGVKNLNISKAGNFTNAFLLPSLNLRLVFK